MSHDHIADRKSSPTGLLTTDSSSHFMFQIQGTKMPALQSAKTAMASQTSSCTSGAPPLVERDDSDVNEEATCVANELMNTASGLLNPNGLVSTFRTQIVQVAEQIVPDFVPNFLDERTAKAFGLFLAAGATIMQLLFPGLAQTAWHVAGFIAFALTMLPIASNTQGKLRGASGITQITVEITKGKSGTGTQAICPPADQPYDCTSYFCLGDDNNICTDIWSEGCPCTNCPSQQNMVKPLSPTFS